jgi:CO/xanthine dehydrogenase Mo-binding subunit
MDPVQFRLRHTDDPRARAVLAAAAERAKWSEPVSKPRGRGVALALRGGTYVATVAEVEVDARTGAVRIRRLVCAHDCGRIVNPDALRGTIQANLIQSLSRAMKEEVTFDATHVTSADWIGYPVARWPDVPEVEVILLNHPEIAPSGAGEPSSRPTAAAIANAIYAASGARVRRAPLTAARVKAAMA